MPIRWARRLCWKTATSRSWRRLGHPLLLLHGVFGGDTPAPDQGGGTFFLTDDGTLSGRTSPPLIVQFSSAADSASGVIYDIDFDEQFVVQAFSETDSILAEITISAGDEGTGDALATPWGFKRDSADVFSIKFIGTRTASGAFGLGFDNFTT